LGIFGGYDIYVNKVAALSFLTGISGAKKETNVMWSGL